jgi:hypothetical protein
MKTKLALQVLYCCLLPSALCLSAFAQGTAFTYQGRLTDGGSPANGSYDLRLILYTADPGGNQAGPILTNAATAVNGGIFTVALDFGANIFTNTALFLETALRTNGGGVFAVFAENVGIGGLAAGAYGNALTFKNAANSFSGSFSGNGAGVTSLSANNLASGTVPDARLSANIARANQVWQIGGNAGTSSDFIGTTDDQAFNVRVNNVRVRRYRLNTDPGGIYTNAPNVIGGSSINTTVTTDVVGATIAGGGGIYFGGTEFANRVTAVFGTVSGGASNTASGPFAMVGGGFHNTASGVDAAVGGGYANTASGDFATVGGGYANTASGDFATVGGGYANTASGDYSFAAGANAHAAHAGSFVWADNNLVNFSSTTANQFKVRATGGATFVTAIDGSGGVTAGVHVLSGDTAWSSISDQNAKKNFQPVNGEAVLEKLAAMPLQSWNYNWEADTNTPHLGPMAQDFKAAFYPGRDDKSISTLEFDGVELAAIQGLNQKLNEKEAEIETLKEKAAKVDSLEKRLAELEQVVQSLGEKK